MSTMRILAMIGALVACCFMASCETQQTVHEFTVSAVTENGDTPEGCTYTVYTIAGKPRGEMATLVPYPERFLVALPNGRYDIRLTCDGLMGSAVINTAENESLTRVTVR